MCGCAFSVRTCIEATEEPEGWCAAGGIHRELAGGGPQRAGAEAPLALRSPTARRRRPGGHHPRRRRRIRRLFSTLPLRHATLPLGPASRVPCRCICSEHVEAEKPVVRAAAAAVLTISAAGLAVARLAVAAPSVALPVGIALIGLAAAAVLVLAGTAAAAPAPTALAIRGLARPALATARPGIAGIGRRGRGEVQPQRGHLGRRRLRGGLGGLGGQGRAQGRREGKGVGVGVGLRGAEAEAAEAAGESQRGVVSRGRPGWLQGTGFQGGTRRRRRREGCGG